MRARDMLAGGVRLVRTQPGAIAVWGMLYFVAVAALAVLIWPSLGTLFALQQQAAAAQAAGLPPPVPPAAFFGRFMGTILLLDLALLLLVTVIFAAAVRATAIGGRDRFAFLRLGMDELRLIGLFCIVAMGWLALSVVAVLVMVVLAMVVAAVAGQQGPALLVIAPLYLALYVVGLWALVRLSLSGALTVLRGRIVLRDAWRLTRGRFWTLFGVYLLIALAMALAGVVTVALTNPALLSFYAGGMQPQDAAAIVAQQRALLTALFGPRLIVTSIVGVAFNTVVLAFACGAVTTAAIRLDAEAHEGSARSAPDWT